MTATADVDSAITFIAKTLPSSSLNKKTRPNDIAAWNIVAINIVRPFVARINSPIIMENANVYNKQYKVYSRLKAIFIIKIEYHKTKINEIKNTIFIFKIKYNKPTIIDAKNVFIFVSIIFCK